MAKKQAWVHVWHAKTEVAHRTIGYGILSSLETIQELYPAQYDEVIMIPFDVGTKHIDMMNEAFRSTQNIEDSWCCPPKRSTSTGDVLVVREADGVEFKYVVAPFGFDGFELEREEPTQEWVLKTPQGYHTTKDVSATGYTDDVNKATRYADHLKRQSNASNFGYTFEAAPKQN